MTTKIAIIGGGHMGTMIVRGWIDSGTFDPAEIGVAELRDDRHDVLSPLGVTLTTDAAGVAGAETIVLAVSPQAFPTVADGLPNLSQTTLVVSVMAGVGSDTIAAALGGRCTVVRAMPNAPCAIGEGVIGLASRAGATRRDLEVARSLLAPIGRVIEVAESDLDAVTAVSGSGPAYVFTLARAMIDGGVAAGLSPETARQLAAGTITGAAGLLEHSSDPVESMIDSVITPGGTTEAAISTMRDRGVHESIVAGVLAAYERSQALASGG